MPSPATSGAEKPQIRLSFCTYRVAWATDSGWLALPFGPKRSNNHIALRLAHRSQMAHTARCLGNVKNCCQYDRACHPVADRCRYRCQKSEPCHKNCWHLVALRLGNPEKWLLEIGCERPLLPHAQISWRRAKPCFAWKGSPCLHRKCLSFGLTRTQALHRHGARLNDR